MFRAIYVCIGIVAGVVGIILATNVGGIFGNTMSGAEIEKMRIMLLILSFNLLITFAFSIYNSIITASERFVFQKGLAIINTIAKPLLMIPILFLGFKSIALCLVITAVNAGVLLTNYIYCKKSLKIRIKYNGFDKALFKIVFAYSFWIFLNQIVDKVNWSADQFILGAVSGTIAVSVYSAASTINILFINLSTAISGVMLPKISKMVARGASDEELTEEFIKVGRLQYYIVFLMASGLVLFGRQFINLWLGSGFNETYAVALLLIIPVCFPLIQNLGLSIMQAKNRYKFKAISTFIMSIANIGISVFLAKKFGAIGAAAGTAIALIVCNIIAINIYYAKAIRLNVLRFWRQMLKMTIVFSVPSIIGFFISNIVVIDKWLVLLAAAGIYTIAFMAIAYFGCANKYEKGLVNKLISIAGRRKHAN